MFKINDVVHYSTHGICKIVDICEKDFTNELKLYYELRPLKDMSLQIHLPVDSSSIQLINLVDEKEAKEIIQSFKHASVIEFEKNYFISPQYHQMISSADHDKIVPTILSLIKRKETCIENGKKLPIVETKALANLQGILFNELAIVLNTTYDEIESEVLQYI